MNITLKIFAVAAILAGASDGFCPITEAEANTLKTRCQSQKMQESSSVQRCINMVTGFTATTSKATFQNAETTLLASFRERFGQ